MKLQEFDDVARRALDEAELRHALHYVLNEWLEDTEHEFKTWDLALALEEVVKKHQAKMAARDLR